MDKECNPNILEILKSILDIDQKITGIKYLKVLIQNIATTLEVPYVVLGHPVDEHITQIQTDIVWANGQFADNFIYDLKDTPCELVLTGERVCIHEGSVSKKFPNDTLLQEMQIESYIGAPVISSTNAQVSNLLLLLDDKPMKNRDFFTSITELLALRAGAENKLIASDLELEKQKHKFNLQEKRYHDIVHNIIDIVWEVDVNGVYTYISPQVKNILGYEAQDILGKTPFDLMHEEDKETVKETFVNLVQKQAHIVQLKNRNLHKNGDVVYLETSGVPIFENGQLLGYRGIDRDVTKRVLDEMKLKETTLKVEELNKNLQARVKKEVKENEAKQKIIFQQSKMASMGEMIENIAHQWRQPLSLISTASSGLKFKKEMNMLKDEDIDECIQRVQSSTQHLSETITTFRDFFKTEVNSKEFILSDTVKKTLDLIMSQFKNSKIIIEEDVQSIKLYGLENDLIQVLINILNNARDELIKKEQEVKLIGIKARQEGEQLVLKIYDNAGGIDAALKDKIFESHFTTKKSSHGTGIGLAMSQMIIQEHMHGSIEAKNINFSYKQKEYSGAEFTISLPLN